MRPTPNARSRRWCLTLGLLGLVAPLAAQDAPSRPVPAPAPAPAAPRPPRSQDREVTWPAPTAEDWARPCLIPWQRSWEDAQALSRETGKPILVCVNMDGEIASEHYAGVRYRQPEIAALYEQYVCVIASVYRHTPRDHDEQGRRILCPRFGSVTCGEHIALEGQAYQRYFDGQRVAPRHVGVELEGAAAGAPGAEMFDMYYAWDTESVFNAVRQGLANRVAAQRPPPPSDPSLPELLASPDVRRREQVEALWAQGDRDARRALLEAALAQGGAAPLELLRLAVFSGDLDLSALGRRALAQTTSPAAPDVIIESLDLPMPPGDQQALIDALARLGADSPRARSIAQARTGLAGPARVDVAGWSEALAAQGSYEAAAAAPGRVESLARQDEILASTDGPAHLELAESLLALAEDEPDPQSARWLYLDAKNAASEAESLGAGGPRSNSVLALAALSLGDADEARRRLDAGVGSVAAVPGSRSAMEMLELFAQSRQAAIAQAVRENKRWPPQWLADVDAAYDVLVRHPDGTDRQALMHYDFVNWFGADARAEQILEDGLARFPGSWDLHDRLRARLLRSRGVLGLEAGYEARIAALEAAGAMPPARAELESFAGYASLVAAEFQRREGRGEEALAAYERALRHYERAAATDPARRDTLDHFVALALAGRARVAFERGDDERALADLLSSFARKPEAAATLDGLSVSAVETAQRLRGRLRSSDRQDLLATLDTALDQLDPAVRLPPEFERNEPGER
jgi:tetratricopeptide (TPR) repeat protein